MERERNLTTAERDPAEHPWTGRFPMTAIARKPKNAFIALIACVLVLSVAAGCTFTGAPTDPANTPEPTTAGDAVYEKLTAAIRAMNSRDAVHTRSYITITSPAEEDPATQTDFIEGWVSGDDLYEEQTHLGKCAPRYLRYGGNAYNHRSDGLWTPVTEDSDDPYSYRITLPQKASTMTWLETEEHLDISFTDADVPGAGAMFRLSNAGQLIWYSTWTPASILQDDGSTAESRMYVTTCYLDTDPVEIRRHLDTVAPELIADMEFYELK